MTAKKGTLKQRVKELEGRVDKIVNRVPAIVEEIKDVVHKGERELQRNIGSVEKALKFTDGVMENHLKMHDTPTAKPAAKGKEG